MTTSLLLHPVLPFAVAAALGPWVGVAGRRLLSLLAPAAALAMLLALPMDAALTVATPIVDLTLLRADALARVFAIAFIVYAFIAGIYAWTDTGAGPKVASFGLAGAGVGVVLAGDLLTLFFFWEWLTVTSLFLIWYGATPASWAAGFRYLIFHLAGALVMLVGILMQLVEGDAAFTALAPGQVASWLILAGMVTNAAVPPLHAWLPDAYPRASIYGTVFLSAFTTKAAVYALVRGFPGLELLVWAGAIMAFFGVFYAVLENDIRKLLSYHIVSQVGFMVAGVGLGTQIALNGATSHAFAHIFYKGLLMMSAGAVIHATGRSRLTELGQLGTPLRWTMILMLIGAFAISGVPLFSGFVTKSMTISAAAYAHRAPIELILFVTSMGTFLSVGLKMPWFTFAGRDRGARVLRDVPASMYLAMAAAALLCIVPGLVPHATIYRLLPFDYVYDPFTGHHYIESLQLLLGTALGFWLLRVRLVGDEARTTLDTDWLYRRPLTWSIDRIGAAIEWSGARTRELNGRWITAGRSALTAYQRGYAITPLAVQVMIIVAITAGFGVVMLLLRF
jgi:multicomponent Na+:H+ antiporter subunit D